MAYVGDGTMNWEKFAIDNGYDPGLFHFELCALFADFENNAKSISWREMVMLMKMFEMTHSIGIKIYEG